MELEDLKNIWKNGEAFKLKNEVELASMLRGTSQSIISKLKKSVWFELLFTIGAGIALFIYALTLPSGALKWTSLSILIMLAGYSFYYIKKLVLLIRFDSSSENIKSNLEKLYLTFSSYLKFYKRSYTILYPVYFCLGLIFGALERGTDEFLEALIQTKTIIYLVFVAAVFFFCSTWLTTWYLRKLYGNQMDKLRDVLYELKQDFPAA
ncbi:hypothetical protein [Pseudochryseolinea flava]|uniref:Uncharacterized protein n=1 Tax=Pseudochryseolinea flava TaxID=2059302 RepID=A0A364Y225_9BACT|nr:hypothetical protein [Pseudochryseolinea flava]RAW00690.1 hypothetical protein DQQ10_13975 [Pseudochryseolinea flava]